MWYRHKISPIMGKALEQYDLFHPQFICEIVFSPQRKENMLQPSTLFTPGIWVARIYKFMLWTKFHICLAKKLHNSNWVPPIVLMCETAVVLSAGTHIFLIWSRSEKARIAKYMAKSSRQLLLCPYCLNSSDVHRLPIDWFSKNAPHPWREPSVHSSSAKSCHLIGDPELSALDCHHCRSVLAAANSSTFER